MGANKWQELGSDERSGHRSVEQPQDPVNDMRPPPAPNGAKQVRCHAKIPNGGKKRLGAVPSVPAGWAVRRKGSGVETFTLCNAAQFLCGLLMVRILNVDLRWRRPDGSIPEASLFLAICDGGSGRRAPLSIAFCCTRFLFFCVLLACFGVACKSSN